MKLLEVKNISSEYTLRAGALKVLRDVSFDVESGRNLAVVGESGSGKSTLAYSLLNLIMPWEGKITSGEILFHQNEETTEILKLAEPEIEKLRGGKIAMIFQDPTAALNPVLRIGEQLEEAVRYHNKENFSEQERKTAVLSALKKVKLTERVYDSYPHQLSGGQKQRAVIATALINTPRLIIADEPTSGLDATIAGEIVELLLELKRNSGVAFIIITHDLRLAFRFSDEIIVLYAGEIVEKAKTSDLFHMPFHPYTKGLLRSLPNVENIKTELSPLRGSPPEMNNLPRGCPFYPRCENRFEPCQEKHPEMYEVGGANVRCFLYRKAAL